MREDMAKVIVERPRIKSYDFRKGRAQAFDDLPAREGMRRAHALLGERKQLNENLGPLRRYLAKQVGRPWHKIYSEIAANLRVDSTVQQHVRDHLRDFVAVKPRRLNGWRTYFRDGLWWEEFYVDPSTGLLCRTDQLPDEEARRRAKANQPRRPPERVIIDADRELRLIKGLLYEVVLAALPDPEYAVSREIVRLPLKPHYSRRSPIVSIEVELRRLMSPPVRDVVTGALIPVGPLIDNFDEWKSYRRDHPDRRYAIAKRMLSRRDLRRHGLCNSA